MSWLLPRISAAGRVVDTTRRWITTVGPWWAASVAGHLTLLIVVGLIAGTVHVTSRVTSPVEFDNAVVEPPPSPVQIDRIPPDEAPIDPSTLDTATLLDQGQMTDEQPVDFTVDPVDAGEIGAGRTSGVGDVIGTDGFDVRKMVIDAKATGTGSRPTSGGQADGTDVIGGDGGLIDRGPGRGREGSTLRSERAVAAALNWFARHQDPSGGWSLGQFNQQCKDATCTGAGNAQSDAAATSFALLPFLAAGQTHKKTGPYQRVIHGGLYWLVNHQAADGKLTAGSKHLMYTHGLCSIAMCEAYGMTQDKRIGAAAQAALRYIETAQNTEDGGWRYTPGQPGDTSVVGWQLMALKSGQMAGLNVNAEVLARAKKYLKLASSKSKQGGLFGYLPDSSPSPAMTGVGLLCSQYSGMQRGDTGMIEGMQFLMRNLPDPKQRNSYYWYYATQVMHNLPGPEWDTWNRTMRRTLIESQVQEGCAAGSWDPQRPVRDSSHAESGGRIMTTSLATLTLEVYYRYLPLYKLDKLDEARQK